jgi:hypothetical protein
MPLPSINTVESRLNAGLLGFSFYMDERIIVNETIFRLDGIGEVSVAQRDNDIDVDEGGSINLILKVIDLEGATHHFLKEGYMDSYGDMEWHHGFKEVYPKTKTIVYFD